MSNDIKINEHSKLFDKSGMFHKRFPSDFRQIRYFTLLVVQKAPPEMKEINLLEQQISELIKNAIKHGNDNDPQKHIDVWFAFTENSARVIVQDEGQGFTQIEKWNAFNRKRNECFEKQNFEEMADYVSFLTEESDEQDNGNALFAAVEYWNGGVIFNERRNGVAVCRTFQKRRHGIQLSEEPMGKTA